MFCSCQHLFCTKFLVFSIAITYPRSTYYQNNQQIFYLGNDVVNVVIMPDFVFKLVTREGYAPAA